MKLLFDQNISFRTVRQFKAANPDISHVSDQGLENATDLEIWQFAKMHGFTIVTFDADFFDLANLMGCPPKIIWLRVGNINTQDLTEFLNSKMDLIQEFLTQEGLKEVACLEIRKPLD